MRRQLRFDYMVGNRHIGYKYFFVFAMLLFLAISAKLLEKGMGLGASAFDCWFALLYGVPEYVKTSQSVFRLPILNMLFVLFGCFMVGSYPYAMQFGYGRNAFFQVRNRRIWWTSKVLWVTGNITLYYLCEWILIILINILCGNNSVNISDSAIAQSTTNEMEIAFFLFIVPWSTMLSFSMIQLAISVFVQPIWGYLLVVVILVLSTYWSKPWWIGNGLILARSSLLCEGSIDGRLSILFSSMVIAVCILVGLLGIKRKDLLGRGTEE